jgi:long-subunit fatty acid transport protein
MSHPIANWRTSPACLRIVIVFASVWVSTRAEAGGFEDTVTGALGLGRAASLGRVQDFMATWQNPANLAVIPGSDLGLELRLPVFDACFDRVRVEGVEYRDPGSDSEGVFMGSESFDNVCNEGALGPTGNLGWAQSFETGWGYGIGLFTPGGVGDMKFGRDTIVTWPPYFTDEVYTPTTEGVEWPNRQMLLEQSAVAAWLSAGAGFQVTPELRIGLSVALGMVEFRASNVSSLLGGTFRDQETLSEVRATDWAVPRVALSFVASPISSLDVFGMLYYHDDVRAEGEATFEANGIQGAPLLNCLDEQPGPNCGVDTVLVEYPFPTFEATVGLRYVKRRTPRARTLDPMRDEVWDLELDASWLGSSNVDEVNIRLYEGEPGPDAPKLANNSNPGATPYPLPATTPIPRRWKDTWSVRVGSDYNVLPSRLAVRAGVSYASSAVRQELMAIDAWPVQKIGLHLGATMAFDNLRLSLAYAHLFIEHVSVPGNTGQFYEVVSVPQGEPLAVNEGEYRASLDVVSIQANLTF